MADVRDWSGWIALREKGRRRGFFISHFCCCLVNMKCYLFRCLFFFPNRRRACVCEGEGDGRREGTRGEFGLGARAARGWVRACVSSLLSPLASLLSRPSPLPPCPKKLSFFTRLFFERGGEIPNRKNLGLHFGFNRVFYFQERPLVFYTAATRTQTVLFTQNEGGLLSKGGRESAGRAKGDSIEHSAASLQARARRAL